MHARSVNGILAGLKIQTRRIMKPAGRDAGFVVVEMQGGECWPYRSWDGESFDDGKGREAALHCPYGQPGDRLWVREAFSYHETPPCNQWAVYRDGTGKSYAGSIRNGWITEEMKFKPSIHMPRWASRLTLEITGIRVERVQDISNSDALAEGVPTDDDMPNDTPCPRCCGRGLYDSATGEADCWECDTAIKRFSFLWDDTNGKGAWDRNDWVWVLDFKKIEGQRAGEAR